MRASIGVKDGRGAPADVAERGATGGRHSGGSDAKGAPADAAERGATGGSLDGEGEGKPRSAWASDAVQGVAQRCFARIVTHGAFEEALRGGATPALPPVVAGLPLPLESLLPAVDALVPDLDTQGWQSRAEAAGPRETQALALVQVSV